MRDLIRTLYRWKIKTMWYFGLGYGEVNGVVTLAKDIAILLGFAVIVFKFHLSLGETVAIGLVTFLAFIAIGIALKKTGMSDYQTRLGNSVNPEIKMIPDILERIKNLEQRMGDSAAARETVVGDVPKHPGRRIKTISLRQKDGVRVLGE